MKDLKSLADEAKHSLRTGDFATAHAKIDAGLLALREAGAVQRVERGAQERRSDHRGRGIDEI